MQPKALAAVTLTAVVLFGGYVVLGGGTTPSTDSPVEQAPSPTESLQTDTRTPTPPPTEGSYPPSIDGCRISDVPNPGRTDDITPSTYPDPPANVTIDSLKKWTQSFEMAYFRNIQLADESEDDEYNLTAVDAAVRVKNVTHTEQSSLIRLDVSGGKTYSSGLHADARTTTGYVITETRVLRVPLQHDDQPIRSENGTVVVRCH